MEKKNLTVLIDTANTIASADENFGSGVTGEVTLYSAEDRQSVVGSAITALTIGQGMFFAVVNADGSVTKTDTIMPQNMIRLTQQATTAGVGQRSTISAFENIDCESEYCLKVRYNSPEVAKNYGYQAMIKTYSYVTRCCGTACGCPDGAAWDVAMGLAEQLNNDPESSMNLTLTTAKTLQFATVLNSTTPVAANDPDEIWTLTKGSKTITCATDIDYASGTDVAAGDHIRIMNGGGTVTTAAGDVFRVEAADATALTITLDRPWPHATQALDTTGDAEVIPKATAEVHADSVWSVIIDWADGNAATGIIDNSGAGSLKWTRPYVATADLGLECNLNCNGTVTATTTAVQPEGYGYSIIQKELWANKGSNAKKFGPYSGTTLYSRPVSGEDYFATAATAYTFQFIIDWIDTSPSAATDSNMPRPKRLIIATTGTTISNELNVMFDSFNVDFNTPFVLLG